MKNKIISFLMAGAITISLASPAWATPTEEILKNQEKYEELNQKIDEIQAKIYNLNEEISPLAETISTNNKQMENIKEEIKNTNEEIEVAKEEIAIKEELLGNRLRELYKSGGQNSYLMLIFSSASFSDLINNLDSAAKLISIDRSIVKELNAEKESLDEKIKSLEVKAEEITRINDETNKILAEFEEKKLEQEVLIEQVKAEQATFDEEVLAVAERSLVSYQIEVIETSQSISDIQSAISQLNYIKSEQLKSPIVLEEVGLAIDKGTSKVYDLQAEANTANNFTPNRGQTVSGSGNSIVDYAYQFIGTPYVYGATGPDSFDCSGFTSYVYRNVYGVDISRTTYSQINAGYSVSYDELQPGDLVFTYGLDHVGIYVGNGQYIHAPQPGDSVKVSPVTSFYAARRVVS